MEATTISMVKMSVCKLASTLRDGHEGIRVGSHHARWKGGLMGGGGGGNNVGRGIRISF